MILRSASLNCHQHKVANIMLTSGSKNGGRKTVDFSLFQLIAFTWSIWPTKHILVTRRIDHSLNRIEWCLWDQNSYQKIKSSILVICGRSSKELNKIWFAVLIRAVFLFLLDIACSNSISFENTFSVWTRQRKCFWK